MQCSASFQKINIIRNTPETYFGPCQTSMMGSKMLSLANNRSNRPEVFCKKGVLRNFAKFTEKHLCQSLFFNKVARPEACNFIKKEILTPVFSCEFNEISKNTFSSYRTPPVVASVITLCRC